MTATVQVFVDGDVVGDGDGGPVGTGAPTRRAGAVNGRVRRPPVISHDRVAAARDVARSVSPTTPVRVLDGPDGPRNDPYRLAGRMPTVDADAIVLVAPRRRGPRRLSPGPVVDGRPVALVQADRPTDLAHELPDPDADAPWVIAAMAKNVFLDATEGWADRLRAGGHDVIDLRADRARRADLVAGLQAGPRVVLYAGHGRPRGWAGYQALRFRHLAPGVEGTTTPHQATAATVATGTTVVTGSDGANDDRGDGPRAAGLVIAFACDTLGRAHNQWPFGVRLVEAGLVRAYLGPASAVLTADATALSIVVINILTNARPTTVTELVTAIDRATTTDASARRAWQTFRLVGAPDTVIS